MVLLYYYTEIAFSLSTYFVCLPDKLRNYKWKIKILLYSILSMHQLPERSRFLSSSLCWYLYVYYYSLLH